MKDKKKSFGKTQMSVLYSVSNGYMMLPYTMISAILSMEITTVNFFVPVIVIYTIQRACIITLRAFGEIRNPYRIIKGGLWITLLGAALLVLSSFYQPLLMVSALLIGIGLSPYSAMFAPLSERLLQKDGTLKKAKTVGLVIYLLLMVITLVLKNWIVTVLFFVYIAYALYALCSCGGDELFSQEKAFDTEKHNPIYYLFGSLTLLVLLILSQYKQSGIAALIWLAPVAIVIQIVVESRRHMNYQDFSYQTIWTGALKTFTLIFGLIYHSSVGNSSMSMLIYLAIAFGSAFKGVIKKYLVKLIPESKLAGACMILAAAFSFLLVVPSQFVNLIGIFLAESFADVVGSISKSKYMKDERHVPLERSLVRVRINTAGGILEQAIILFSIYLIGEYNVHRNLLEPYAVGTPDPEVGFSLRIVGLICSAILLISACLITYFYGRRNEVKEIKST